MSLKFIKLLKILIKAIHLIWQKEGQGRHKGPIHFAAYNKGEGSQERHTSLCTARSTKSGDKDYNFRFETRGAKVKEKK